MLVAARLRQIASTKWGRWRYFAMELLLNPPKQEAVACESDPATAKKRAKDSLHYPHDLVAGDHQVIELTDVGELQRIAQVASHYTKCCEPHL